MSESIALKVTSAFLVGGEVATPGEIVEVTVSEAKDLLQRGKAVLAVAEDAPMVERQPGPISMGEDDEAEAPKQARRSKRGS